MPCRVLFCGCPDCLGAHVRALENGNVSIQPVKGKNVDMDDNVSLVTFD